MRPLRSLRSSLLGLAVALVLVPAPAAGQGLVPENCDVPGCKVSEVIISTGYDHNNGTVYTPVTADAWWTLVQAPNLGLVVPSPAFVITPHVAWTNQVGSRWISAYSNAALIQNNASPNSPYSFERCICVCEPTTLRVQFDLLVDNVAAVYFDGVLQAMQANPGVSSFQTVLPVDFTVAADAGDHCLRIDVRNLSGVAMGLNVQGTIQTSPPGGPVMISPQCCEPDGKLIVCVFADNNCDGVVDSPVVPLVGWTIKVQPGGHTAVTDGQGYAYFELPPGNYTAIESVQSGWVPGTPVGGTQPVTIATGSVQTLQFLNCPISSSITLCKFLDVNCDGLQDAEPIPLAGWTYQLVREFGTLSSLTLPFGVDLGSLPTHSVATVNRPIAGFFAGTTNSSGYVTIPVPAGTYSVTELVKSGWFVSNPLGGSLNVTLGPDQSIAVDFFNCPPPTVWTDLGCATSGPSGTPNLTIEGDLLPGSTIHFNLTGAPPGAAVQFVLSSTMVSIPFFCGTLKVEPFISPALLGGVTDANGNLSVPLTWPNGVPSGTPVYVQAIVFDPSHRCGGFLSNALCTMTP
jgi:hypothetical protein